jgi:hypothetical protein
MESVCDVLIHRDKLSKILFFSILSTLHLPFLRRLYLLHIFIFFDRVQCVGHSFAYVARFVFLRDVLIRTVERLD